MGLNSALHDVQHVADRVRNFDFVDMKVPVGGIIINAEDFQEISSELISHLDNNEFDKLNLRGKTKRKILASLPVIAVIEKECGKHRPYTILPTKSEFGGMGSYMIYDVTVYSTYDIDGIKLHKRKVSIPKNINFRDKKKQPAPMILCAWNIIEYWHRGLDEQEVLV